MTDQQPVALRLAAGNEHRARAWPESSGSRKFHMDTAAELRRLHQVELALKEWISKTEWVQATAQPLELGRHRADVIKQRFDHLSAKMEAIGAGGVGPLMKRKPSVEEVIQMTKDAAVLGNIESLFNACMHQEYCKRWKAQAEHQHKSSNDNDLQPGTAHLSTSTTLAGWKLVPVTPTIRMRQSAWAWTDAPTSVYQAMLAAAPQPPKQKPAIAVPAFNHVAQRKLDGLLADGWAISGYSIIKQLPSSEMRHGFVTAGGLVGWWQQPTTAEQPPAVEQPQGEQEPVPVSWVENFGGGVAYGPYHEAARNLPIGVRLNLYTRPQPPRQPQFDACSLVQELLAVQFCAEIAGPRGGKPSLPDPVRLLEMAEALYQAEFQQIGAHNIGQEGSAA